MVKRVALNVAEGSYLMRIAIMQPYFLPYIGYFQLMSSVDKFVLLDDVNYIKKGWINRNRLPGSNGTTWLTLALVGASQNRLIREIEIMPDDGWKRKMVRTVAGAYAGASEKKEMLPQFEKWVSKASGSLSEFLWDTLNDVAQRCGILTEIVPTASIYPKGELRGQHRILDICLREGARTYVNPPGGQDLYDHDLFASHGVELKFLQPELTDLNITYSGSDGPVLSIFDLLMQNSCESLSKAVHTFELAGPADSVSRTSS